MAELDYEVHRLSEKLLQCFQQTKIGVGIGPVSPRLKLVHEVQVTSLRMVVT